MVLNPTTFGTPPIGNTGVNSQLLDKLHNLQSNPSEVRFECGVDWVTLILRFTDKSKLLDVIDFTTDQLDDLINWTDWDKPFKLGRWFMNHVRTVRGAVIAWNVLDDGTIDCLMSLNGGCLAGTSQRNIGRALSYLNKFLVTCSRFDLFFDDYNGLLGDMRPLIEAARDNGQVTGFKNIDWRISSPKPNVREITLYLGSRQSDRYYRIYDKDDRVRFECEMKNIRAKETLETFLQWIDILSTDDHYIKCLQSAVTSFIFSNIDFIQKKDKNLSRATRLPWWEAFLSLFSFSKIKFPPIKRERTKEKAIKWIERQVETTLAMLMAMMGVDVFSNWMRGSLENGKERFTSYHELLIENDREVEKRDTFVERMEVRKNAMIDIANYRRGVSFV